MEVVDVPFWNLAKEEQSGKYVYLPCFVLFCFVLFCFVLFCFVLFCFVFALFVYLGETVLFFFSFFFFLFHTDSFIIYRPDHLIQLAIDDQAFEHRTKSAIVDQASVSQCILGSRLSCIFTVDHAFEHRSQPAIVDHAVLLLSRRYTFAWALKNEKEGAGWVYASKTLAAKKKWMQDLNNAILSAKEKAGECASFHPPPSPPIPMSLQCTGALLSAPVSPALNFTSCHHHSHPDHLYHCCHNHHRHHHRYNHC
jgi:hypothetical protein